eukprot:3914732-Rhodomonas_salina.1
MIFTTQTTIVDRGSVTEVPGVCPFYYQQLVPVYEVAQACTEAACIPGVLGSQRVRRVYGSNPTVGIVLGYPGQEFLGLDSEATRVPGVAMALALVVVLLLASTLRSVQVDSQYLVGIPDRSPKIRYPGIS